MAIAATFEARVAPSIAAYSRTTGALADAYMRISSGNRIVRQGDDSSSISAATNLQTQTSTLRSSLVSGARATSFLQVAYDGLAQVRAILSTLDDLTSQANNSGQTTLSYATLDGQLQSGLAQIDRIVATTTFNGASILDGSADGSGAPTVYVGDTSTDTITLAIPDVSTTALFGAAISIGDSASATAAATSMTSAGELVDDAIAKIDAYQLRLDTANATVKRTIYGVDSAIEQLLGADTDAEKRTAKRYDLQQQTAAQLLAQAMSVNTDLLSLLARG